MIIVTGSVTARPDKADFLRQVRALAASSEPIAVHAVAER